MTFELSTRLEKTGIDVLSDSLLDSLASAASVCHRRYGPQFAQTLRSVSAAADPAAMAFAYSSAKSELCG